ncbi:membrane protein insertase YidC [Candidatus Electronema sp. JM]|uniref:membrane protein insertase YidC n=1 Tax=Candidatus Electronema sp. JM TaxID=3401571 RepID=UPI003AA9C6A2
MDTYRALLAIILSMLILLGWQYLFPPPKPVAPVEQTTTSQPAAAPAQTQEQAASMPAAAQVAVNADAREIKVEAPLYKAVFFEQGGGLKSFILKSYRQTRDKNAPSVELITVSNPADLPLAFSLDGGAAKELPLFKAEKTTVNVTQGDSSLLLRAELAGGLRIERKLTFHADNYLIGSTATVTNGGTAPAQLLPALSMSNGPLKAGGASNGLFSGPTVYVNKQLKEIPLKELAQGPALVQGEIGWAGHMDSYFMLTLLPEKSGSGSISISHSGEQNIRTVLSEGPRELVPGASVVFAHEGYFGPKKLSLLKEVGYGLEETINFGWLSPLARPMLWLLNFFHNIFGNYGIAIILLTCAVKGAFWPITHKGMKSMKNMQKIQPKVAKLREKFKDDPVKMNQEMMAMYKTYKVNPLGGCLPMLIQIPFFFALYRVLMAAIELRHAPFLLWINDLSAPDRLMIGFDIPVLHGIPVLTLLMGGTMFLQQKMTPTTADPQQAKMMQMMPVIFTVMFVNFASGLVLYWFVSNLLSILQQQLINRQNTAEAVPH